MAQLDRRRLAMLDSMGIDVWVTRTGAGTPGADSEPEAGGHGDDGYGDGGSGDGGSGDGGSGDGAALAAVPAGSAAAGTAGPDWDELSARVARCTRCELHRGRTQTVFGVGNRKAAWLVIGEAPGAEEDRRGEPFVGRAGQLLNAMLAALGLAREQVYIANILKCRPPHNRDPKAEEVAACSAYLARQVELIAPRIILAVGRIAAQNLLGTEMPIGRMRGRLHHYGEPSIPVVVTYHPAYLLRSPAEKSKAWTDLRLALATFRAADVP